MSKQSWCGVRLALLSLAWASTAMAAPFAPPVTPRHAYDFDAGWKFIKQDVPGAEATGFDDHAWETVSTPHTYNDVDTYDEIITRGGEKSLYMGPAWYRKPFILPADAKGQKVFLELEGARNTAAIYVNGKQLSLYTNGVTPHGVDITPAINFDGKNELAVRVDNGRDWKDAQGNGYQWGSKDFNPNFGGLNQHVRLHVVPKLYQTFALYDGLKTTGTYVYAGNISVADKTAEVTVESQFKNETGDQSAFDFSAVVVDADGQVRGTLKGETYDSVDGESSVAKASGRIENVQFWSPERPYLYDVYSMISVNGKVVDVVKTTTGFRKIDLRGGVGTGGVYINDKFTYLKGYAQRSSNEWAGLGSAYPDWMHDLTSKLIVDSHANYVRWMHVAPKTADVRSFDRHGIVQICPAGDKEKDAEGPQWDQRVDVMRSTIIAFRNSPSILFWEAGNSGVSTEHMQQMQALWKEFDPNGGRAMGCRSLQPNEAVDAAGFLGVMIADDKNKDNRKGPTDVFRAYSEQRRDKLPIIEVEDFRDEAARRFWDDYSPPHFGFKKKGEDTWEYTQETFSLAAVRRYDTYLSHIITNKTSDDARWSGYASIIFADTVSHGRQYASEVCRVSGKVDAVRIPKEAYNAYRVIQNPDPDVHILGHWTYPAKTKKTVYVIANADSVELLLNGKSLGKSSTPQSRFIFSFPDVTWQAGTLKAVATSKNAKKPIEHELTTVGPAASVKLAPIVGPGGLKADGADVALFDVEVVDAEGRRCPTDEGRIDFAVDGPGVWRGGYNSGKPDSTNKLFLDTECGINRVSIRSTQQPGTIRLTAKRNGLNSATAEVTATGSTPSPLAAK